MPRKTNVTINGSDYCRVTATVGWNPDGTRIRKQFYGDSKRAAEEKRDEYMEGLKQGLPVDYEKITFGNAFEHWLYDVHCHTIGPSTKNTYSDYHRRFIANSKLSGMRLIDVKAANIQVYYKNLETTPQTIYRINKILKTFFKYCIKSDILTKTPLLAVELPRWGLTQPRNTALYDADIDKLISACKNNIKHFPYLFACFTGVRAGELLALTYKDINFNAGMVSINKAVRFIKVDGKFQFVLDIKTPSSRRDIPILKPIAELLQIHMQKTFGGKDVAPSEDSLLFPTRCGTYREQSNFLKDYKRLCKELGIEKGCTVHSLRHTFCTILARRGVPLLDASRLMGHKNIAVTAKYYIHGNEEDKKNAVNKLDSYFSSNEKNGRCGGVAD